MNDHDGYRATVAKRFAEMDFEIVPTERLDDADAIFVGGGNTWRLLKSLYDRNLLDVIRDRVRNGLPYIGSSAGSVIAAPTIRTTNDMPAVQPPTFDSLGLVPFQLNCHYLDPDPHSTHKGETREERIRDFHEDNATPVIGLREGTLLHVVDGAATLHGIKPARIFRRGEEPFEVDPGTRVDELLR